MPQNSSNEFDRISGVKLAYFMDLQQMSTEDLAGRMDLPVYTVRRHLRGKVKFTAEHVVRYAQVLHVAPTELLPRLDSNQQPAGSGSRAVA